ncbi:bifunctional [glutamine synthetase] adenylyltransferase/[glutamine synthetase]-adenylyl-L-tyrosine phosphorylase [Actinopolymorpha rutila]|uniref:Bifunctional glutamine synthetase adenylyltransferase/adenylyl-removing enzyme n=1 Tax=Actinopolymorpha rutila TaxID=446787 RepID=A0A852ZKD6_9ACTN|nr:bifunctional [glutamine synthetase] adenylyltransferase/[glutamine synthetase]-adenylyl-L-tyrosine phosphorylase [Actinopolymorpha rutila]NYH89660.1 glutamate-ammonia-ligase adenylyltransferase [Actinopolymorpha rutila]
MTELRTPEEGRLPGEGQLVRWGFAEPEAALRRIGELPAALVPALDATGAAADPDQAVAFLVDLVDDEREGSALVAALVDDETLRRRLLRLLGASTGLAEHLIRHPEHWRDLADPNLSTTRPTTRALRADLLTAVGADPEVEVPVAAAGDQGTADALRVAYHRLLLRLAVRDLGNEVRVDDAAAELADLAAAALEASLAVARARLPHNATACRLAIIGMGKTGGRELNYVSDVDVLFVAEPAEQAGEGDATRTAAQLATQVIRICSEHSGEGTLWPVDAGLRPEGKAGPLVRSVASYDAYYQRWAKTWEFQALLKARAVAGDRELGARFLEVVDPLVWRAAERDGFVADVQAMRRRVVDHIPAAQLDRQLKLGPGGLRDVEFAVQLLQLVHGRSDPSLRRASTLRALDALTAGGYVGRDDGAALAEAYRFLRTLEHRIQLSRLRRTHLLPEDEQDLRALGRSLGLWAEPVKELTQEWKKHVREVRRLHEKLFYRPLLAAVARIPTAETRLTPDAARARLTALGYTDSAAALRHIEALVAGVSRRASIQRTLLPVMLEWFADAPDPDGGLLAFRQVSEELGSTPWYLRLLRDEGVTAERMARVLASSKFVVDLLRRAPEAVAMFGDDRELRPRTREQVETEMLAAAGRYDDPATAAAAVRAIRRRELLRVAAADVLEMIDVDAVGEALTDITAATLSGGLVAAVRSVAAQGRPTIPTRLAVVAMGRFGGHEMSYGSDADVIFVHEPYDGADEKEAADAATAVVSELRRLLAAPAPDPPVGVDADLRPEGRQGPLVRTLASYTSYYARWSHVWEAQALLRAESVCGDPGLRERFMELVDGLRWPDTGLTDDDEREIRRIKARVDAERLPRGADPTTHTKLGRGGLADVEWTVQLLQLRHGAEVPGMRTTRTVRALEAATDAGLVAREDADDLLAAWRLATRARNAMMLVRDRRSDSLPRDPSDLAAVSRLLGYEPLESGLFLEDYRRITRHARSVVERIFWE